jgi:hypothetical protein
MNSLIIRKIFFCTRLFDTMSIVPTNELICRELVIRNLWIPAFALRGIACCVAILSSALQVASAIRPKFILFGFGGAPKWVLRRTLQLR